MKPFYAGDGPVSAAEQAEIAYREVRRSLVKYAEIEAEYASVKNMTPAQDDYYAGRRSFWVARIQVFSAVYQVESAKADRDARRSSR